MAGQEVCGSAIRLASPTLQLCRAFLKNIMALNANVAYTLFLWKILERQITDKRLFLKLTND